MIMASYHEYDLLCTVCYTIAGSGMCTSMHAIDPSSVVAWIGCEEEDAG